MISFEQLREQLSSPKNIAITTHPKPDADALGSSLALSAYLKKKNHNVRVITPTDYPKFISWMEGNEDVTIYEGHEKECDPILLNADIFFCLDFSTLSRIDNLGEIVKKSTAIKVIIDHHLQPEHFADFEYWNDKKAATCELIFDFIVEMGDKNMIDVPMGECIYAGIMTDTGSFRFEVTSSKIHQIISDLIEIGVNNSKVHRLVYDNNSEMKLRFLGFALSEKLKVLPNFGVAYFAISAEELNRFNSQTGDTEGLVNYALSLEGITLAAIIIERPDGIKMSFRSSNNFSVNDFARTNFAGGGHRNAAGGLSKLSLRETEEKFLALLPQYNEQIHS